MTRFGEYLGMAGPATPTVAPPEPFQPLRLERGTPIEQYGPTVTIAADGQLSLFDQPVASAELTERLLAELDQIRSLPESMRRSKGPPALLIWVDARANPAKLAKLKLAVPDGLTPVVVAQGPPRGQGAYRDELEALPSVVAFRNDIRESNPAEKATTVARRVSALIDGRCEPLEQAFGELAAVHPADKKAEFIAERAPAALRACDCKVDDLPLLEYIVLSVLGVFEPPVYRLTIDQALDMLPRSSDPVPAEIAP